ncbi:glycoside hydrolase family 36 protein [Peterkaempfera bronchialis]|uniref:Alpha-galactosidase n=1 Tax=Peterkaempfera bronchialis TaxID=2126346 RepID=A0A345SSU9_9ACTN|nr:glycoside hydrolase family 36 protein [Peterkaempfera bronchialis]AXI76804.1 alpha-galactosidase [Peterkaempfera bronchialis]
MAIVIDLGGRSLAVQAAGTPEAVSGGVILPPGRVAVLHGQGDTEFYRHGWNSWSPTGWRTLSSPPLCISDPRRRQTADDTVWHDERRHHSSAVAALDLRDGTVLLLGSLGLGNPRLTADQDTLVGWYESGAAPWFLAAGPETEVFSRYAELLAKHLGGRRNPPTTRTVWCSWYSYYEDIDEAGLLAELPAVAELPFEVFQVDDGWEEVVGDWEANAKFPSGMAHLAERVTAAGLAPGLWLAPFIALPRSRTVRERPELFLRDRQGGLAVTGYNWDTGYHSLDLTLPEAQDHLRSIIARVVGWGYRYLKLDFVYAAAAAAERAHDIGREEVYRDALALIRETAGEDVYLLGSGALPLPSLGLLDGIRIGPDVGPFWSHYGLDDPSDAAARNAVAVSAGRLWLDNLYDIDPDVAIFRTQRSLLTDDQRRILADLATACRFRAVSDPPSWLSDAERAQLTAFLTADPDIRWLGRNRVSLDGRRIDFPVDLPQG